MTSAPRFAVPVLIARSVYFGPESEMLRLEQTYAFIAARHAARAADQTRRQLSPHDRLRAASDVGTEDTGRLIDAADLTIVLDVPGECE